MKSIQSDAKEHDCHILLPRCILLRHYGLPHPVISLNTSVPVIGHLDWLSKCLHHMSHGRGLEKSVRDGRFFSDVSEQIWI